MQLETYRKGKFLDLLSNSALGLIDVYNLLPTYIVEAKTTKDFQQRLQALLKEVATEGKDEWNTLYCPRKPLHNNKLRNLHDWGGPKKKLTSTRGIDETETQHNDANKRARLFANI